MTIIKKKVVVSMAVNRFKSSITITVFGGARKYPFLINAATQKFVDWELKNWDLFRT
jgi:hypothetical protein